MMQVSPDRKEAMGALFPGTFLEMLVLVWRWVSHMQSIRENAWRSGIDYYKYLSIRSGTTQVYFILGLSHLSIICITLHFGLARL